MIVVLLEEEEEDKAKTLPVCFRFLLGSCFDEHCPYPHVNVNPLAAVCEDFLTGYCPQGSACKLLHTYECQTWVRTGECDDPQCRFKHPRNVRGRRRLAEPPVPVAGSSALSSLPSLTSSDVIDQPRADNGEEEEEEEGAEVEENLDLALLPEHELGFLVGAVGGIERLQRLAVDVEQRLGAGVPQEVNLPAKKTQEEQEQEQEEVSAR
ncbi:hypothetical protein GR268_42360 [Rhizobium leguminosarum]|nr:hypothetical protein [Rhizobium leguminosarum]